MTHQKTPMQAVLLRGRLELRKYHLNVVETKTSVPVFMAQEDVAHYLARHMMAEEGAQSYRDKLRKLRTQAPANRADVPIPVDDVSHPFTETRTAAFVNHDRYDHAPCGLKPGAWDVFKRPRLA
ncbi:hypothetical protein AB3Y40_18915 [Yoonia sp. R2331]|uniref:hypothetical protein n=1 Tax=Yoonia sp. R2331 TaxID=3237238 RepID=UPI0034E4CF7C